MSKNQEVTWNGSSSTLKQTKRIQMVSLKKLTVIGCVLVVGFALIKWIMPRYTEIDMAFSEPLPDGNYIVTDFSDATERIKIKHGKIYCLK